MSIDPTLAVALAKAAGLDAGPLEDQIRRRQEAGGEEARLRERVAELEGQLAESTKAEPPRTEGAASEPQGREAGEGAFAQGYLDALNASRTSHWIGEEKADAA